MCSGRSDTPLRVPSFLIRTSTDRSSVGSSPWLIAASHVLLRLQAPRHPPLALRSLKTKMLVLAMEFSRGARNRHETRALCRTAARGLAHETVPASRELPCGQKAGVAPSKRNSDCPTYFAEPEWGRSGVSRDPGDQSRSDGLGTGGHRDVMCAE